jgi:hypothetical protein
MDSFQGSVVVVCFCGEHEHVTVEASVSEQKAGNALFPQCTTGVDTVQDICTNT